MTSGGAGRNGLGAALSAVVRALRPRLRPGGAGAAGRSRGAGRRGAASALAAAALAGAVVTGAACSPAVPSPAGGAPTLFVAGGVAGTITRLDGDTGRPLGPPVPGGPLPWQLAGGPDGSLLVLSGSPRAARPLTRVTRADEAWAAQPVALAGPAAEARLAGDGGRLAAVVHRAPGAPAPTPGGPPPGPGCRLALVDVLAGAIVATATPCAPRELLTGLVLEGGPAGPVAYLALWGVGPLVPAEALLSPAAPGPSAAPGAAPHRVLAAQAQTGAPVAVLPLAGVPGLLAAGPGPGRQGRRLYAVERLSGPEDDPPAAVGARLLGLHPTTLEVESERRLGFVPARLVVAPDGDAAYALHDHRLTRLGLDGGPDRSVALPERGLALAVSRERVYVSSAYGPELWAFRRRDGRLVATIRVGQVATDLLTSPGG